VFCFVIEYVAGWRRQLFQTDIFQVKAIAWTMQAVSPII
jgi:hypothetical protein